MNGAGAIQRQWCVMPESAAKNIASLISFLVIVLGFAAHAQPDYSHLLRIQISVAFDGERIDFDETIFCGDRQLGTLTRRPVRQVLPSHFRVSEPTRDGGFLSFPVSWILCSLGQSVWRPGKTPETEFKAPADYLPPFLWLDDIDPDKRTYGEEWVSESAFNAPDSRLKILSPMRFSIPVHPAPRDLIEEAFERADWNRVLFKRSPDRPHPIPVGYFVFIPEEEWSDISALRPPRPRTQWDPPNPYLPEKLVEFLNALPPEPRIHQVYPLKDAPFWLFSSLQRTRWHDLAYGVELEENGVPHRNAERFGLLTHRPNNRRQTWADRIAPYACDGDGVVRPDSTRTGIRFWRSQPCVSDRYTTYAEINGTKILLPGAVGVFFDAFTRELIFFDGPG